MLSFLRNFLEPFCYLFYAIALYLGYKQEAIFSKKVLFVYYIVAFVLISYACIIAFDYNDDNNWLYNIHYVLTAFAFGVYFYSLLQKGVGKTIIVILFSLALINNLATGFFVKNTFFNSYGSSFLFLCVVVSVFIYSYQILNNVSEKNILRSFDFWLCAGYLLYFLGSFFIILSYNYFAEKLSYEQRTSLADLWAIQNILLFISSFSALIYQLWMVYQMRLK